MIPTMKNIQQATDLAKAMSEEVNKKYQEDFKKIEIEFKNMTKYINGLEDMLHELERKVDKLEETRQVKKD